MSASGAGNGNVFQPEDTTVTVVESPEQLRRQLIAIEIQRDILETLVRIEAHLEIVTDMELTDMDYNKEKIR